MFRDRQDAGRKLAAALASYKGDNPLVLALPRGGVVVGAEIARGLDCDLDVMLVKKLRAPFNPELAIGAISEDGTPILNEGLLQSITVSKRYLEGEVKERMKNIQEQQRRYRAVKPRVPPADRVVILTDDGLATGATMRAAVLAVAAAQPQRIVVAVPGGAPDTVEQIQSMAAVNEVICLAQPPFFSAVGELYGDFRQVEDEEVVEILRFFEPPEVDYGTAP
jgi:predicted phosphoribosyltransferase